MLDHSIQQAASPTKPRFDFKKLSLLAVIFGIAVRLVQYLSNRSLWGDEIMLASNIVDRTYAELLQPLDYNQAAPPGFLWIEKLMVQLFGNSEYTLRLFPFVCGLVALSGFYRFAQRYGSTIGATIAIALFASSKYVIYYATEVKQYSSDVMVALLLLIWLIPLRHQLLNNQQILGFGLLGAALIWLSHPTVFVLAGIELSYFAIATMQQRWRTIVNRWPLYLIWLFSFVGLYFATIQGTLNNDTLTDSWNSRYPNSWFDIAWALDAFGRFFYNPLGFLNWTDGVAIFAFVIGCLAIYYPDRLRLLVLTAPMLVTLLASYLGQYPFRDRLVLFLVPLALLILAEGVAFLIQSRQRKSVLALGILVFASLLVPAWVRAAQLIVHPLQVEEIRPVMAYVQAQQQPDDRLYVYRSGRKNFLYYAPQFGYTAADYALGEYSDPKADREADHEISPKGIKQLKREIKQFRGQNRVWFLFCSASESEEKAFLSLLNPIGQQLDAFKQTGAAVYLYRLQ